MKRKVIFIMAVFCAVVLIFGEYSFSQQPFVLRADRALEHVGCVMHEGRVIVNR